MFYKKILTLSIISAMLLLAIGLLPVHGEEEIYNKVVRLHVLANSDSEEDQAVKLKVRDAILEVTVPLLQNCKTKEENDADKMNHRLYVAVDRLFPYPFNNTKNHLTSVERRYG